jgi:hypothetical protein
MAVILFEKNAPSAQDATSSVVADITEVKVPPTYTKNNSTSWDEV